LRLRGLIGKCCECDGGGKADPRALDDLKKSGHRILRFFYLPVSIRADLSDINTLLPTLFQFENAK